MLDRHPLPASPERAGGELIVDRDGAAIPATDHGRTPHPVDKHQHLLTDLQLKFAADLRASPTGWLAVVDIRLGGAVRGWADLGAGGGRGIAGAAAGSGAAGVMLASVLPAVARRAGTWVEGPSGGEDRASAAASSAS